MFRNKTLLFVTALVFIATLFFHHGDTAKVYPVEKLADMVIPISDNDKQRIDSIPESYQQPQIELSTDESNKGLIIECDLEDSLEDDGHVDIQQQYLNSLFNSTSQDRLLEYALFAVPPKEQSRFDLLLEYNREFANEPLVLMEILSLCSSAKCTKNFIDAAIDSDKENGAMWLYAVSFFATSGNDEEVLKAILELGRTSFFNERRGERIKLYAQAVEGLTATDFYSNVINGIGVDAARAIGYSPIFDWCKAGINDLAKMNACVELGHNLEKRSSTIFSQLAGIALQKIIYKAQGDNKQYRFLENENEYLRDSMESEQVFKASLLMFYDEELLRNWLNNLDVMGDLESSKILVEEAILISKSKGSAACIQ
ncbi:hypothetical protein J3L16_07480 [Alteromonas sp. 5E99-2]|uniref:hypothetical protein n=1 Tax=Alteromonas sp. 5E99-2 TaxID=2817683 RepID=UPI001A9A105D|nr:hypothetical protein [Alteromonas sp. 5E99-2]MBO1255521.1 hypothetical protein [Alteromonas sp. 5E99-2]